MNNELLLEKFSALNTGNPGIESLVSTSSHEIIIDRVKALAENKHLSKVQFNQLLGLRLEKGVSDGFFKYYWLSEPQTPYNLDCIPTFKPDYANGNKDIISLDHLHYGLYRIFIDGLLYRGNIRAYFRDFSFKSYEDIDTFVRAQRFDTDAIKNRGPSLPLAVIDKDDRYLISEMACKSYGDSPESSSDLLDALVSRYQNAANDTGTKRFLIKDLLNDAYKPLKQSTLNQMTLHFSSDEILLPLAFLTSVRTIVALGS